MPTARTLSSAPGDVKGVSRAAVQRLSYRPYGGTHANTGSVDFDRHRFTGQEEDPETGLYSYRARYYNPARGRFLSPDSLVPEPGNPQALNRYSYVANNPVTLTDPTGHSWLSSFIRNSGALGIQTLAAALVSPLVGVLAGAWYDTVAHGGPVGPRLLHGLLGQGLQAAAILAGGPLGPALGGGFWGAVGSGLVTGSAFGAVGAALYGGHPLEHALVGGLTGGNCHEPAYRRPRGMSSHSSGPARAPGAGAGPLH